MSFEQQKTERDLEPAHRLHTKVKRHLHRQLSRHAPASYAAAVRHSRTDPNTVKVRLTTADVAALKRIADSRGLQPEDIARDILQG